MAYKEKSLTRQGGVGYAVNDTKSIFGYATADTLAAVAASGYFNSATKRLRKGDIIHVMASLGGTVEFATLQVTSATGAATVTTAMGSLTSGLKMVAGQATTVTASDTIATGLGTVSYVVAVLNDAPVLACMFATADVGNQSGAPAAGSFLLKTWKPTASGDATPIAATTFGKKVNWIALGS